MARITHFEIHAADPKRALRFYGGVFQGGVFGWPFRKGDGPAENWLVMTGEGRGRSSSASRPNPYPHRPSLPIMAGR